MELENQKPNEENEVQHHIAYFDLVDVFAVVNGNDAVKKDVRRLKAN